MSTTIESLELEIISNSKSATTGIDALTTSLGKLKNATKNGMGLTSVINNLRDIKTAADGINSISVVNLRSLADAIRMLSGTKIPANIATQITAISNAFATADFSTAKEKMSGLVDALSPLASLSTSNLGSYVSNLQKLPDVLTEVDKIDMAKLKTQLQDLADAFKPLGDEMEKVANGFSAFPTKIQRLLNATNKAPSSVASLTFSFSDLLKVLKKVWDIIGKIGEKIWGAIEKSSEYTENLNLFTVAMGDFKSSILGVGNELSDPLDVAEHFGDTLGIDESEWVRAQGVFMTLATGFGVASDRAGVMSENLTQLGYDLSSFYNMDVADAMTKLKSGLAGELEPLRAVGYDLSEAKLAATALELGIDKAVSSMTQAEKAELRYYAIMTQVIKTHGDLARTLDEPANQIRVLKAEFAKATREIGNIFIPILQKVLPPVIAIVKAIRLLASTIASLAGYEMETENESTGNLVENTSALTENLQNSQKEVKKLKSYMLGFDELNVINPNTEEDTSNYFDFELPTYDFLKQFEDNPINDMVDKMTEWLGLTKDIKSWSDLLKTNFGNILVVVGLIGVGIAAWNISLMVSAFSGLVTKFPALLKAFATGIGIALKAMGAVAVIAVAVASTGWLVKNTDTTIEKIGAIISGAALAVGAILAFFVPALLPLGIGLMAVGAVSMGAAIAMNTDKLSDEVKGVIAVITTAVSLALLAVGAVLAFSGANIPLGIALMAGGALTLATAVLPNWNELSDTVKNVIQIIMASVGAALLVLGAIFAFSGANIPLGIAFMVLGGASLGAAMALNWNAVVDALRGPVGLVTAIISGALLALGAIFVFSGALIPLGIAFMALGAAGLATVVAVNWDAIVEALRGPVGRITAIISGALLVLGAILLFTGVGIPLGLGLMLAGAAGLGTVVAVNWDFLVDKIKEIWAKITTFWNTYIAPVFTAEWWGKLGKTCINGLIIGFEAGINGIIVAFESMINWIVNGLNSLSFDIPEWLGGGTWGINLQRVSFKRVSIPRLADGAYDIPAGQMFIAREAGAEMVGTIGRKTAVANNDQIVSGIAGGVATANEEQNALLREQNSLLRAILEKDSGVYLDGKNLTNSVEKYQRERGRVLITGGVI